jgi:hypothetical protein
MTNFQIFQIVWMVLVTAAIPILVFMFRTGHKFGTTERRRDDHMQRSDVNFAETMKQLDLKLNIADLASVNALIEQRFGFVEQRINDLRQHSDARFEAGGHRISELSGKIIDEVARLRDGIALLREQLARVDERLSAHKEIEKS